MAEEVHNIFLITSVVNTPHSAIPPQQRINETLESIASVKIYYPTCCSIILIEGSNHVWDKEVLKCDANILVIYQDVSNHHKSVGEARLIQAALDSSEFTKITEQHTNIRVFKLSARYTLTNQFNTQDHICDDKLTLLQQPSETRRNHIVTITVLYSVPKSLLDLYRKCLEDASHSIVNQHWDIEHALFQNVDSSYINQVSLLGVRGRIAPTGVEWSA